MKNINDLCFSCMYEKGNSDFCPECGFNNTTYEPPLHHLRPGTILAGKYILGKALGEGGFGITYIGYDINLEIKTAIKEYFPNGFVTRDVTHTDTVTIFSGSDQEVYEAGKEKFINEAKTLAKFDKSPGIVSVKDFFLENGTAYIVMEYVDGETLKDYLNHTGGAMDADTVFNMLSPLIRSLAQIHTNGMIHRDISPDNIMITSDMNVKLLDFGAARDISADGQKSLSIQLKPGYAPEEQYRSHGNQGPWTDVYALCATMYRAITGAVPEESLERMQNDILKPPSQLGIRIDPEQEKVLMRGLEVYADQRVQDMSTLYGALFKGVKLAEHEHNSIQNSSSPAKRGVNVLVITIIYIAAALCALGALILITLNYSRGNMLKPHEEENVSVSETVEKAAPTAEPIIRTQLYNRSYTYKRMSEIHNSVSSDDNTFRELGDFIKDFDKLCVDYMNTGNTAVLSYLEPGSTAYTQQTNYKKKHASIHEVLNGVEVFDCRDNGDTYYLWVSENRTVTENGKINTNTDHWVYAIKRVSNGYVVSDYTKDPGFN